jgi:hypothetical protein
MGSPVPNQRIYLVDQNNNQIASGLTDTNGNYSIQYGYSVVGTYTITPTFEGAGNLQGSTAPPIEDVIESSDQATVLTGTVSPASPVVEGTLQTFSGNLSTTP